MIEEGFAKGDSFIHKLDPVIRIIAAVMLSFCTAVCDNLHIVGFYLGFAIVLAAAARLNIKELIGRLKPLIWFVLMVWILLPLTFGGEIVYQYSFIKVSLSGLIFSAKISIKSVTIILIFITLINTMTVASLGHGLHRLYLPDKLVFLFLMSYRYVAVFEQEYKRLLRAARFRGFNPGTNLHSYKTFAYLAGMLFVRASLRANRVYQAMICRGFNRKFYTLDIYQPTRSNLVFFICVIAASAGLIYYERILLVS